MNKRTSIGLALAATAALGLGTFVAAQQDGRSAAQQDGQAGDAQVRIDPKAEKVLRDLAGFIENAQSLRADVSMDVDIQMQGMKQQQSTKYLFAVRRPNKLAMKLQEGTNGATVISNGEKLYTHMPQLGMYTVKDAPERLSELGGSAGGPGMGMGGLNDLFGDNPYQALVKDSDSIEYLGEGEVDGAPAHRLLFHQEPVDVEVWLGAGERPLPLKMVPDMSAVFKERAEQMPEQARERMKNMKMEMVIRFNDWQANEDLPADTFAFTPPEDAKKVESFAAALGGGAGGGGSHPLEGKPAPQAKLDLLGGGQMNLAKHEKQDEVVILDFWATWCGPCRQAMPIVEQVAEEYKDRGVQLYAVNLRESPEQIKQFLESENLDVPVALDRDGQVGNAYQARSIPQTVIIGPDGQVRKVVIGFRPDLKQRLSEELDKVLGQKGSNAGEGSGN